MRIKILSENLVSAKIGEKFSTGLKLNSKASEDWEG